MKMGKAENRDDAFQLALKAILAWDGKSVHHLERLTSDADEAFKNMSRADRGPYCIDDQAGIDVIIANAIEDVENRICDAVWEKFEIPTEHPDLAAVDAEGEPLYFSDRGYYSRFVVVGSPLEEKGAVDAQ